MLVPETARRHHPRMGRSALAVIAMAGAALFGPSLSVGPSFVPPPVPERPAPAMDATEWMAGIEQASESQIDRFQEAIEDGIYSAADAMDGFLDEANNMVGPSLNPQLLPAGCRPMPQEKGLLEKVLEPVTEFFLRYQRNMEPRCKECKMIIRFGRIVRTCIIPRHKARQPGISGFKKKMNNIKGSWKQLR
mmetsp:Transcript_75819/g.136790  ORF Transcript_75819/g.136790 Transcript_75819/m.136790 type:complete len:191 (-) Transcript_75819:160-732(-)